MSPSNEPMATPARSPRWLRTALIASLALNLVVIGVVGGLAWRFRHPIAAGGPGTAANLMGFAQSLPAERRQAVREIVRTAQARIGPLRKEARRARGDAARAITTEPFDRPAVEAAIARQSEMEASLRKESQKLAVDIAALLTAEERKAFTRWRGPRRGWGGGRDGGEPDAEIAPHEGKKK